MALNKEEPDSSPPAIVIPRVSIIVPTYNRKKELSELLACLDQQTITPSQFEIIIVDDGSTDDTIAYLESLKREGRDNVCFTRQANKGPGAARNLGMSMAKAPVFAFTDTDCRPLPDWLEQITKAFRDRRVGAVGGAEASSPDDPPVMLAIHFCMTSALTTGGLRGKQGKKLARYYPRTFNMAISREAFQKTGGFKPLYHGEDVELSFRIKEQGFSLWYNEQARVLHRRRSTISQFFMQLLKMGKARVTLARFHPGLLEPLHLLPAAGLSAIALLLVLGLFFKTFYLLLPAFLLAFCLFVVIGFSALQKTKNRKVCFLAPLLFIVQQLAYGLGFYWGLGELLALKNPQKI